MTTYSARWRPPRPALRGRATAWPASAATSSPLLAPGAGASGVLRLLRDLRDAIEFPATFAAGLVPDDACTPEELVAHADARLLAQKRDGKSRQPILSVRGVAWRVAQLGERRH